MPYMFAHEDLFVIGVMGLIVALLVLRVLLMRRRRSVKPVAHSAHPSPDRK